MIPETVSANKKQGQRTFDRRYAETYSLMMTTARIASRIVSTRCQSGKLILLWSSTPIPPAPMKLMMGLVNGLSTMRYPS
ncbi:hypothetical protein NJ7G_2609 [Natrinema sp. J7-2]|nr:hypothetical protein NJ7G_2609 [Natrinema sp. J7-2]